MSELVLEAGPEAREIFESFASEHPEEADVEVSKGADGATLICLIIENAPHLSASIALLIGAIRGRGFRMRASKDGVEIAVGDAAGQAPR